MNNDNAPPARRVLFVDHVRRILGGAEINLVELVGDSAARTAWDIQVACDPESSLHDALQARGIPCHPYAFDPSLGNLRLVGRRFPVLRVLRSFKSLVRGREAFAAILERVRPDFVVSCTNKDHFAVWPACRAATVPSVWWVNDILSADFFPWAARRAFVTQARRGASRVVVVSDFARRPLLNQGLPEAEVVTIHNGIPLDRYEPQPRGTLRHMLAASDDEPLIGVVGRFTPWKGQDFFLRIAEAWCRQTPSGRFVLVGHAFNEDQRFELALRNFIRLRGLRERVHVVPFQRDIGAVLSDLDLLVHCSLKPEPFGRVLIEGMAIGIPVLGARAGGVPEIIEHGTNGLLARPGDLADYLAQIRCVVGDAELRARLRSAGRETVRSRFSIARVQNAFDVLFDGLVA
ncbi:MAG: glycosyltransferase family 4 protein [Limisphaerales bacterium]